MWHYAELLDTEKRRSDINQDLNGIEQLDEHEFNMCLKSVHQTYVHRPVLKTHVETSCCVKSYAEYVN